MKSITVEQLAAEDTLLREVRAVPSLPFPADGPGSPRLYAGGVLGSLLCCLQQPPAGQREGCAATPRGARQPPLLPQLGRRQRVANCARETRPDLLNGV